jgi:cephalosporin-C deacetylase
MPLFDLDLDDVRRHTSTAVRPPDFDAFWSDTVADAQQHDLALSFELVDAGLDLLDVYDLRFAGFAGQPINAWLLVPAFARMRLACVVEFVGYGGGRGFPAEWLFWPAAGYSHLVMDTRGQGSSGGFGDTPDLYPATGPHAPGFLTLGVQNPRDYYYRRVYTDAIRAVEAARNLPQVDPDRVIVAGGSQGGGICLAVAGLVDGLAAALPDVPFMCDFRRATGLVETEPYNEIVTFLRSHRDEVESTFATLDYFDGSVLAQTASAPALFSVGLMDDTCPPSAVYSAFNGYAGPKQIREYAFNKHDGGGVQHRREQLQFLRALGLSRRAL